MYDRQSQAHSTHRTSFDKRFKNTLRLNRDQDSRSLPKDDGVPSKYRRINSVTRTKMFESSWQFVLGTLFVVAFLLCHNLKELALRRFMKRLPKTNLNSHSHCFDVTGSWECTTLSVPRCLARTFFVGRLKVTS